MKKLKSYYMQVRHQQQAVDRKWIIPLGIGSICSLFLLLLTNLALSSGQTRLIPFSVYGLRSSVFVESKINPHNNGDNSSAATNRRWLSFYTEIQNTGEVNSEVIDRVNVDGVIGGEDWRNASYKAAILRHQMYEQLLAAHVACLRDY